MTAAIASGQWTLGVLVGLPVAAVIALLMLTLTVGLLIFGIRNQSLPDWDYSYTWSHRRFGFTWASVTFACLLAFCAGMVWTYWPLSAEYHQYRPVSGTVAQVGNRFVSAGGQGGTNQKFVVTLTSGPQQYGITDTRAALLKPGDHVSLRCIRVYEYGSNDAGYDCKWGQS